MNSIVELIVASWSILLDSGIWLLLGFAIAGLFHVLLPVKVIAKYLTGNGFKSTLSAVILGAPMPLCSCSVIPVAKALRDGGASRGATTGFLISAPETGADTIALSWALLGPIWVIARPIAAIVTALTAGILQPKDGTSERERQEIENQPDDCCCDDCHCGSVEAPTIPESSKNKWYLQVKQALKYGFIDLPSDLARYLLPGILIAGVIAYLCPPASLATYGHGFPTYLAAMLIGLPLYICSSASTPLAASLLAAGVAPGPILVFLLTGPASNVASFGAVRKMLGLPGFIIQLIAICGVALLCGFAFDALFIQKPEWFSIPQITSSEESITLYHIVGAVLVLVLLVMGLIRDLVYHKR